MRPLILLLPFAITVNGLTFLECASYTDIPGAISPFNIFTDQSYNWTEVKQVFNLRLEYEPAVVVYPQTIKQIQQAARCANRLHAKVTARSGGNDFASFSLGGEYHHIVIDLKAFNSISLDPSTNVAVIGPAARVGAIRKHLFENGQRTIPLGSGPNVAFGGLIAHGGFGLESRQHGLTIDNLIAIQAILANGTLVTTSASQHPEVFWALKGAAPSFGIITSATVATQKAPKDVHFAKYRWSISEKEEGAALLTAFQNFSYYEAPAKLGMEISVYRAGKERVVVELMTLYLDGATDKYQAVINPLLDAISRVPYYASVRKIGWLEAHTRVAASREFNNREFDCFYSTSLFTPRRQLMKPNTFVSMFSYILRRMNEWEKKLDWSLQIKLFGGHNNAISKVPTNSSAFAFRDRMFNLQFYAASKNHILPYPQIGIEAAKGIPDVTIPQEEPGWDYRAFANYVDPEFTPNQWKRLYYGDNYGRLTALKRKLDPRGVFSYPQSIGTV